MKKILLLYDFFSEHGGVERIMYFQAKSLKKAGYDVSFAFAYVDQKLKKERLNDFNVIEYSKLPIKNEAIQICSSIFRKKIIDQFKGFDLIICHSFPASYIALKIRKKFDIPYVLHLHHPPQFLYNVKLDWAKTSFKRKLAFLIGLISGYFLRKFDSYCVRNADFYFSESEVVKKIVKETYKINSVVSYPTVNEVFRLYNYNIKELVKYGITKDYILGSGRIIRQKRFDYLIEAFSKLNNKDMQLVLAGKYDESERINLENLAKKNNIEVLFLGPLDIKELKKLYSLAKVTVLTCPEEWFGLVPIESMACGCPVVAWEDNFGPQETVINGKNGYLAKPYNITDLSEKIKTTINKKWDRKQIVKSVDKFSEEKVKKEFLKYIKKIIKY